MLENLTHPLQCPIFEATKKFEATKGGGGVDPDHQDQHPHHSRKRLAVPYSPTTHQLQYHQRRKA